MSTIIAALTKLGPSRSSTIVEYLKEKQGLSDTAARQRISRAMSPVLKFPIPLLPNREVFLYLKHQRVTENFWLNLHKAMRDTNSVYGAAIDGLLGRGGIVLEHEFDVISGAPLALKKQVSAGLVAKRLEAAGAIRRAVIDNNTYYVIDQIELGFPDYNAHKARTLADSIILEAVRDWIRKLGLASYNKINIRGDEGKRLVGAFAWDLTGPSYLLPLRNFKAQPGFVVADVFSEGVLDENGIQYFIRKAQLLKASLKSSNALSILIAEGFDGRALTSGHKAGIVLATTENLFGQKVAQGIHSLLYTLRNAAAIAVGNPERLASLLDDLSHIEGAAGNLRGILFELIAVYLAKEGAVSVDFARPALDPKTGKKFDIDVLRIINKAECTAIECKGKAPGGILGLEEIEEWIGKLPIFRGYLLAQEQFRNAKISFEIWTTGTFTDEATARLEKEKASRVKSPIAWKDGKDVLALARRTKEIAIVNALNQHYLKHPLSTSS